MKQLMYMWMSSVVSEPEYYLNRLVYMLGLSKVLFTRIIMGKEWSGISFASSFSEQRSENDLSD